MGSILTSVFGGGGRTSEKTTPDEVQQALNKLVLGQVSDTFDTAPFASFATPKSDIYSTSDATNALIESVLSGGDLMSLDDYVSLGIDSAQNYISQVAKPEILSTAVQQGLEGSGFVPVSLAKATAGMAIPFLSTIPSFMSAGTQRNQSLLGFSDFDRSLKEEDLLRQQSLITTALTGIPVATGSKTTGRQSTQPLFNFFGQG